MQPRLTLFGLPAVSLAGRHENLSRRAARVATWLTWYPGPATSEQLLGSLFGDVPEGKRAVRYEAEVRNGLSELRKALTIVRAAESLQSTGEGHALRHVRSDLKDAQDAVETGRWGEVGYISAAPFLESRGRGDERVALRDESWAGPISRRVESWRTTAGEVYDRVTTRGLDEDRSLARLFADATRPERDVVRVIEWGARLGIMTLFDDVEGVWTRLTGADQSAFVSAWAWATDPVFGFVEAAGGRGVPAVVTLRRSVIELGVTDGEHGWDVQDAFAPMLSSDEALQASTWIRHQGVNPSPGLLARSQTGASAPNARFSFREVFAAAVRADRFEFAA